MVASRQRPESGSPPLPRVASDRPPAVQTLRRGDLRLPLTLHLSRLSTLLQMIVSAVGGKGAAAVNVMTKTRSMSRDPGADVKKAAAFGGSAESGKQLHRVLCHPLMALHQRCCLPFLCMIKHCIVFFHRFTGPSGKARWATAGWPVARPLPPREARPSTFEEARAGLGAYPLGCARRGLAWPWQSLGRQP